MRFPSSSLLVIPALAAVASAHGSHHGHLHHHNKRSGSVVITSGANGLGDNQVHTRLEISDLAANRPEQWALFIQAMSLYQNAASSNVTGYHSIAKIHGVPREDWDGVPQCESCSGADGYCPHDSVLFPAWHRAYMALYEQEFLGFVYEAAYAYPTDKQEAMLCAASTMRFPYWDWAASPDSGNVLPTIIASAQVTYDGPNGSVTTDNPLYQYTIPDPSEMYYGPFTSWSTTKRWPESNNAGASSEDSQAVSSFDSIRANMQDSVYNLLTVCNDYLHFSNDDAGSSSSSCSNSLEGIHNTIHTTSGGPGSDGVSGGHMTYLPLAAFDPIFWLHHCNVDRLFALWQTVNPDSYGATQTAPHNTWTIAAGTQQGPDSPLEPFRKDASNFWTTNEVRDWASTFKYTYPEFSTSDGSRSAIISYINGLYGSSSSLKASSISEQAEKNNAACGSSSAVSSTSTAVSSTKSSSASSAPVSSSSSTVGPKRVASFETTKTTAVAGSISTSTAGGLGGVLGGIGGAVSSMESGLGSMATGVSGGIGGMVSGVESGVGSMATGVAGGVGGLASGVASAVGSTVSGVASGLAGALNSTVSSLIPGLTNSNGSAYQYVCNVNTPRYALNGSYYVYVFDGEPANNDSSNYLTDKNLIGCVGVLGGGEMAANVSIAGSVPLTRYLQNKVKGGLLSSLAHNITVPYLTQNLNWKIVKEGKEVDVNAVSGFQASVFSGLSSPAGKDTLPVWSALQPQVQVTKGKAGGLQVAPSYSGSGSSGSGSSGSSSGGACPAPKPSSGASVPHYGGNVTSPVYPTGSNVPSGAPHAPTGYSTTGPAGPAYTGAASKASFGVAGVLAVAGLVAML